MTIANGSVSIDTSLKRWQADFATNFDEEGLNILATLQGAAQPYTAEVTSVSVLADPGISVDRGPKGAAPLKIGYAPTATGKVTHSDVELVVSTFYSKGIETGERSPVRIRPNGWRGWHRFKEPQGATPGDKDKLVSNVVIALVWDAKTKTPRLIQASAIDLQVG